MTSKAKLGARAIAIASSHPRAATTALQHGVICILAFAIAVSRFRDTVAAAGMWVMREVDPLALLAPGGLAIAAACLLPGFDLRIIARLCGRVRRRIRLWSHNRISEAKAGKKMASIRLVTVGFMLGFGLTATPANAEALTTAGADTVRSLYDALLANMQSGAALGARGRFSRIEPVVRRTFNMPLMTRLAVGPEWERLNDAQRQQVSQAFERYISAVYAERFDSYAGEKLQVTGEQPSPGGTIITTEIVKSNGEPIRLNYLMRQSGGAWQIADVYLNGTISELATRRSEFSSILRAQGIDGLIAMLNNKAESLAARAS